MKIKHLMIAGCLFTAFTLQSCIKEKDLYQAPPTTYSELNLQLDGDYLQPNCPWHVLQLQPKLMKVKH